MATDYLALAGSGDDAVDITGNALREEAQRSLYCRVGQTCLGQLLVTLGNLLRQSRQILSISW